MIDGFVNATGLAAISINGQSAKKKPSQTLHQRAEKAHTLMRGALKKPSAGLNTKVQHPSQGINYQRESRAQKITKHTMIDRFGSPVEAAPPQPAAPKTPVIQAEVVRRSNASAPSVSTPALPSMITSVSHQKLERLLDEALTKADSHKQALKYHAARHFWQKPGFMGRHRGIKLSLAGLLVLGVGLFVAWQKFPQLSVKLAAVRAHVAASVPSYKPDGYKLAAPATTQAGAVILKYTSAGGGYDLTQKPSDITSQGVAQTVVPKNTPVQTTSVDGNTVYIYGSSNNAAWINNGVLYTIKDQSKLSPDEINGIVKGLD